MNVFIFPTDDRSGQAALIYHYQKMGHNVFIPKFGTLNLPWHKIATWPALLCNNNTKIGRNFHTHRFERSGDFFGEDSFLFLGLQNEGITTETSIACEIIDLDYDTVPTIDAFHTLRGGENELVHYFAIAHKYFPNAKWISSTLNAWNIAPGGFNSHNVAAFIPANYEKAFADRNNVNLMCSDFELDLLNVQRKSFNQRMGVASFNHNFSVRQPDDFKLFTAMNALLDEHVVNYGANVRAHGADTRFSGCAGVTGKMPTLSPRKAVQLMTSLRCIVHLKQNDWGGGVFYHALNTDTPVITTTRYINASNSSRYLVNGKNCVYVDTPTEAAQAVKRFQTDDAFAKSMHEGMRSMREEMFDDGYWSDWNAFLGNLQ